MGMDIEASSGPDSEEAAAFASGMRSFAISRD